MPVVVSGMWFTQLNYYCSLKQPFNQLCKHQFKKKKTTQHCVCEFYLVNKTSSRTVILCCCFILIISSKTCKNKYSIIWYVYMGNDMRTLQKVSVQLKVDEEAVCVKTCNIPYNLPKSSSFNQFQSGCMYLQDQMVRDQVWIFNTLQKLHGQR